jgi:hypothetical protein
MYTTIRNAFLVLNLAALLALSGCALAAGAAAGAGAGYIAGREGAEREMRDGYYD